MDQDLVLIRKGKLNMLSIDAAEIKGLSRELHKVSYEWEKEKIRKKLDQLAWAHEDGARVVGDNGADSDEAIGLLADFGTSSPAIVALFRHGSSPKLPPETTLLTGLSRLGLTTEADRFLLCFRGKVFPHGVLDTVIRHQEEIQQLHPDKYPWKPDTIEIICTGFKLAMIDTKRIWRMAVGVLERRGSPDLIARFGYDSPAVAVEQVLEQYALTRHDIGKLDRLGKEVHF